MPRIFISYRRADSAAITGRIHEHLAKVFGANNVFMDVEDIRPGDDFRAVLQRAVGLCDVQLVIIGRQWLDMADQYGNRRLDDPNDFVRIEIEAGLNHGDPLVIPILVDNASMPSAEDLPRSIQNLAFRNAVQIRNNPHFTSDIRWLIKQLRPRRLPWIIGGIFTGLIAALVSTIGIGLALGWWASDPPIQYVTATGVAQAAPTNTIVLVTPLPTEPPATTQISSSTPLPTNTPPDPTAPTVSPTWTANPPIDSPEPSLTWTPVIATTPTPTNGRIPITVDNANQAVRLTFIRDDQYRNIELSRDGRYLATAELFVGSVDTIKLWHTDTLSLISTIQKPANGLEFSPDSRNLLIYDRGYGFYLWDIENEVVINQWRAFGVGYFGFSPDSQIIATTANHDIRLRHTTTGETIATLQGHTKDVGSVTFSPDGTLLASSGSCWYQECDYSLRIWNLATYTEQTVIDDYEYDIYDTLFSHQGDILFSYSLEDNDIYAWDVNTGTLRYVLSGHTDVIRDIELSPNGNLLASASFDHTVRIWDVNSGIEQQVLVHPSEVSAVTFSPTENLLISSNLGEHIIRLWNIENGQELIHFANSASKIEFDLSGQFFFATGDIGDYLTVFGIQQSGNSTFPGVDAHIIPVSINYYRYPAGDPYYTYQTLSGDVVVGGRTVDGSMVYLYDRGVWVNSGSTYIDIPIPIENLPIIE